MFREKGGGWAGVDRKWNLQRRASFWQKKAPHLRLGFTTTSLLGLRPDSIPHGPASTLPPVLVHSPPHSPGYKVLDGGNLVCFFLFLFLVAPCSMWDLSSLITESVYAHAQSCPILLWPMDCGPPGSSVHGILQARILESVAVPFSRGSSRPRDQTHISCVSCLCRQILYHCTTWEVHYHWKCRVLTIEPSRKSHVFHFLSSLQQHTLPPPTTITHTYTHTAAAFNTSRSPKVVIRVCWTNEAKCPTFCPNLTISPALLA